MQKYTVKNSIHRGFTLIELMIVIVILGVLMGTILPRLTGAQSRARDLGRTADLQNIAQALEVYYDDNGSYPTSNDGGTTPIGVGSEVCLTEPAAAGTVADALGEYLKGGEVPTPPQSGQSTSINGSTACVGGYVYVPLINRGVDYNGYALVSDVETYQNANWDNTTDPATETVADFNAALNENVTSAVDDDDSLFLLIN